jgi:protein-disulfide isomerase
VVFLKKTKHTRTSVREHENVYETASFWMIVAIVLGVLFIATLILGLTGVLSGGRGGTDMMSQSEAEARANRYVNLLSTPEAPLNIVNVEKDHGLYRIDLTVQGQPLAWYMTGDGELFIPDVFTMQDIQTIVGGQPQQPPTQGGQVDVSLQGANYLGDLNSDVLMVEYSSATCPFCARYHAETFPALREEYVETGRIAYVYKHYVRNEVDILAANALECAGEQDNFFEYLDLVYENQPRLGQENNYAQWADSLGLDVDAFGECLSSRRYTAKANADTAEGQGNGVTGTPGFLVNSRLISGAQPLDNFRAAINAELAN